ncbi:DsbA family oxidoreductase [Streptomyces sp. NPDC048581]|uniref:DsbA family oxidoreductase n=1 Tax=unclassified Streptomyces TaxID=2593676 RepID=UPI00371DC169
MRVEIWADIICPWCYIGKARFDRALAAFAHRNQVEVLYRSFELEPGRDKARVEPVGHMLLDRFGSRGPSMDRQVAELAHAEGLDYRTDRHVGSTFDLHRLIHLAREYGLQHQLVAAAFRANFAEARNLFTTSPLIELAIETGLEAQDVQRVLDDPSAYAAAVRADEQRAAELDVPGVPFFLIDGHTVISGGQSVDAFTRALERAWTDSPNSVDGAAMCSPTDSCELPPR